ncbi:IS630 family transposase [Cupriavidus sp. DF5525]|uniref:IS630 family transposase n=1 Tax=Cupriavidus sp. DF5525 TaxID=3160989 RepID=UPI0032DF1287
MRVAPDIVLTAAERAELEQLLHAGHGERLAQRARMVLLAADGMQSKDIAEQLGVGRVQVSRWRERYAQLRLAGIEATLPRGAPPVKVDIERLAALTAQSRPDSPAPWSTRKLAEQLGVSAASISRHLRAAGLTLPVAQARDRQREADLGLGGQQPEIMGLYMSPAEHALVLAVDAGAAPVAGAADHGVAAQDSRQPGVTRLLATLREMQENVQALPDAQQRGTEWLAFLRRIERSVPPGRTLHLLADNYPTHHQAAVQKWLARHPRIRAHFAPNPAAWLRMLQRFFRATAAGPQRAGIPVVLAAIDAHPPRADGKPFTWVAAIEHKPAQGTTVLSSIDDATQVPDSGAEGSTVAPPPLAAAGLPAGSAVESVASTKVMPPRTARNLIPREALMARLQDARRQRCMVVQGQAGSGKTSTLLAWRRSLLSLDYDVTWLTLAPEDNEPTRFFECLLASIGEVDPAIVREAALLIGHDSDDAAIEHWVISLVQGLAARRREIVVMLDDLHHIDDPRIYQALQWLLDYAPGHVHLALSSRSALPLSLERLRSQGRLTEIDMRDLRFTADESERFLCDRLGVIDKRDAAALHALTDGWVAGLQLFAVDMRTREGGTYPLVQVRDARTFASYFEQEVLVRLVPDELDMLTRMAVCNRICASLCASVLGRPLDAPQMATRLARLELDNLFLTQIGSHDRETWYRLHPLLREVLLTRVAGWPEAVQRALHADAWHWFRERGHIDDAVHHAVLAGDAGAAASMVEHCAYELLSGGELGQLASLLRRLPAEQVQSRFGLLVASAYLQLYTRKFDALRESLGRMVSQQDRLDAGQRYAISLLRCGLALQQDDTDTVYALLDDVSAIPPDATDFAWTGRSNVLSWAYVYRGQYDRARAVLDDTGERPAAPRSRLLGRCISAMSLALEGHIAQAERTVREVLHEADQRGPAYAGVSCMATGLLADTLYEQNDLEGALRLLEPRIDVLERVSLPDTVLRALLVLSESQRLTGRRAEADACLARLASYADRLGLDRLRVIALELRMRRHLDAGEMEQAGNMLQRIDALASAHVASGAGKALRIAYGAERARIAMCLYVHDFAGAVPRIGGYIEACQQRGQQVRLAALWLQLGLAQQQLGNAQAALQHFRQGLQIGHRLGLVRTLLDVSADLPRVLGSLLETHTLDPVLTFYVQRLLSAAAATATQYQGGARQGMPAASADALSEREREVLNLVAQAMPNKKIALVLNLSPETVKWHLKNIYAKLGVSGRGGAAARLREFAAGQPAARRP